MAIPPNPKFAHILIMREDVSFGDTPGVNGTWTRLKNLCAERQNWGYFDESHRMKDRWLAVTAYIQHINLDARLLRRYLDRAVGVADLTANF